MANRERSRPPCILVTNDDGFHAPGLAALIRAFDPLGDLLVVAPDRGVSGASHALTLDRPLRIHETGPGRYRVDGTPTDCVHLGAYNLAGDRMPDLVVSGMNRGLNVGDDVTYSGTVAGAMEGALIGIPAIAFSVEIGDDGEAPYDDAVPFARALGEEVLKRGLEPGVFLSVNVPARPEPEGIRVTRQGRRSCRGAAERRIDPAGRPYYWIAAAGVRQVEEPDGDQQAVKAGCISVTPLHADLTHHASLKRIDGWSLLRQGERT